MRLFILVSCLLVLVLGTGCGDDEARAGVRVRLLTSAVDGPVPGTLMLQALDDGQARRYTLERLEDAEQPLYEAVGAPEGRYRVYSDAGWGMLWTGTNRGAAPLLRGADYPATLVRMGKPRTLYVAAANPSMPSAPVSQRWGVEAKHVSAGGEQGFTRVDVAIADQGEGIVSLGFPAEVWKGDMSLRAVGLMSDGSLSTLLSYQIKAAEFQELPRMALVFSTTQAPLEVRVIDPADPSRLIEGLKVRVRVEGIPREAVYEEPTWKGVARFDALPSLGHGATVLVGDGDAVATYPLDDNAWRRSARMVVLGPRTPASAVVPVGADVAELRVRMGESKTFALLPFAKDDEGAALVRALSQGAQDLLVQYGDGTWAAYAVDPKPVGPGGEPTLVRVTPPGKPAKLRGTALGIGPGGKVVCHRLMEAVAHPFGDSTALLPAREAAGHGFVADVTPDGAYEIKLPPGRYRIQLTGRQGPRGKPKTHTLGPGAEARLNLSAR